LLLNSDDGDGDWRLYWQADGRFYMLEGHGVEQAEMLAAAESVR
jgi:hypothetical protein